MKIQNESTRNRTWYDEFCIFCFRLREFLIDFGIIIVLGFIIAGAILSIYELINFYSNNPVVANKIILIFGLPLFAMILTKFADEGESVLKTEKIVKEANK